MQDYLFLDAESTVPGNHQLICEVNLFRYFLLKLNLICRQWDYRNSFNVHKNQVKCYFKLIDAYIFMSID